MSRLLITALGIVLLGCTALEALAAADIKPAFERANRLYEESRFTEAIHAYQALLTNQPTVAVHFNLGNAYFKAGQLGNAIAEYRRAERLAPRDPDVRANLKFARARVNGPSDTPGWLRRNAQTLTVHEWRTIATGAVWVTFGLLIASQLQPKWGRALHVWVVLAATLAVILVACAFWVNLSTAHTRIAVVTQPNAVMRRGPFEESQSMVDLQDGAELRVLDQKGEWIQVTVDDHEVGWLPVVNAQLIGR